MIANYSKIHKSIKNCKLGVKITTMLITLALKFSVFFYKIRMIPYAGIKTKPACSEQQYINFFQ